MANPSKPLDAATGGESKIRGGKDDVGKTPSSADTEIRLDDEKDTLYSDGLDVEDDSEHLAGTRAADHRS